MYFVVLRRRGPEWDWSKPIEEQSGWPAHATFMNGLVDDGVVVLAVDAASEEEVRTTLARDPWSESHLVVDSVDAWTIRLTGRQPAS